MRSRLSWRLAFVLASSSFALPALAQVEAPVRAANPTTADRAAIARARRIIADTMRSLGTPGASICVMRDGRVIWSEGFGFADLEQQVRSTPRSVFRIGSVSKPLTAAALGLLVQEGKLDLDAEVQRYVPSFPRKPYPITVRQLAGHIAGIRHYKEGEFQIQKHYDTVLEGLSIFSEDSLLFEPGTKYSYSSYGWNLLAAVIEGATGEPFLAYMRKAVLLPAGLTHTRPEFADSIIPFRSRFYVWADSQHMMVNAPYVDNSYKWAGGGFVSTAEDLARFGQVMLDGKLLMPETVKAMWTSQRLRDGTETGYGIGWGIVTDSGGRRRIGHTGGAMGGTATLQIYPEQHLVIAMLVNTDRTFIGIAPRLAALFIDR
ncbi:MAG: serine hydrolase domain-containing protein [Gemmatimonadota bacterium]